MRDLLFEIGCEEIPAAMLEAGIEALAAQVRGRLEEAGLVHGPVDSFATPRRLALRIRDVEDATAEKAERLKGPPERAAFGPDGAPTAAAEGFARRTNLAVRDLQRADGYVWAEVRSGGRPAAEVLAEILPRAATAVPWPKSMRWEASGFRFVRPIRWIVCLLGPDVLPIEIAGVRAGAVSLGRRFLGLRNATPRVPIPSPRRYVELLERAGVLVDRNRRIGRIARLLAEAAEEFGAEIDYAAEPLEAMKTLADLVEEPVIVPVELDEAFLDLPPEILRVVLWHHQRYVGLRRRDGGPAGRFLAVRNAGPREKGAAVVAAGNRRVVAARLADARHFFREDRRLPLDARRESLRGIVFHERLGSVFDRTERIAALAMRIATSVGLARRTGEAVRAERAGRLSKADLTTQMVFEFPELQGTVGRIYATHDGELPEVAEAIEGHYRPAGAADALPRAGSIAAAVALADKFDLLAGLFAAGERPGASADPFGMRRAAIGILRILLRDDAGPAGAAWRLSLAETCRAALDGVAGQGVRFEAEATAAEILVFLRGRLATLLIENGHRRDLVEATLAAGFDDPAEAAGRAAAVEAWRRRPDFEAITTSFRRAVNILGSDEGRSDVRTDLFEGEAERALHDAVQDLRRPRKDLPALLEAFAAVRPVVDRFFDDVLVNCEGAALRENRKALLRRLAEVFGRVIDFSRVRPSKG